MADKNRRRSRRTRAEVSQEAEERRKRLAEMHLKEGLSFEAIAERESERLGRPMTRERIRAIIRKAGVTPEQSLRAVRVRRVCEHCGEVFYVPPSQRDRRFKDQGHFRAYLAERRASYTIDNPPSHWIHPDDGHLWVSDPQTRRSMRLERWIAQTYLGRELASTEWVGLIDGNPHNTRVENIVIGNPADIQAGGGVPLVKMERKA